MNIRINYFENELVKLNKLYSENFKFISQNLKANTNINQQVTNTNSVDLSPNLITNTNSKTYPPSYNNIVRSSNITNTNQNSTYVPKKCPNINIDKFNNYTLVNNTLNNNDNSNADNSGDWQTAINKRSMKRFNVGSLDNNEILPAKLDPKPLYSLYLTNVNIEYNLDTIKNYLLKRNIKFTGVYLLNIKKPDPFNPKLSFKIIIEKEELEIVNNSVFWPKGLKIRPWIFNNKKISVPNNDIVSNNDLVSLQPPSKKTQLNSTQPTTNTDNHMQASTSTEPMDSLSQILETTSSNWASETDSNSSSTTIQNG